MQPTSLGVTVSARGAAAARQPAHPAPPLTLAADSRSVRPHPREVTLGIFSFVAGIVIGWLANIVFKEWGFENSVASRVRRWRPRKGALGYVKANLHLCVGDLEVPDWELLDGFSPNGVQMNARVIEQTEVVLPDDLTAIRRREEATAEERRRAGLPAPYNGRRYALVGCGFHRSPDEFETNVCMLRLKYSDYMSFLATSGNLDTPIPGDGRTVRQKYYANIEPTRIPADFLFHSFGVNLAVITKDERVIVVKRGQNVDMLPSVLNSSVDEGLSRDLDRDLDRSVSIRGACLRGLWEELGVEESGVEDLQLTSVGYSRSWCQYGALGHARLNVPFKEVAASMCSAKDASFEIGKTDADIESISGPKYSVYAVRFTPHDFATFVQERRGPFTSWGLSCFVTALLACDDWNKSEVRQAFSGSRWTNLEGIVV